MPLIGRAKLKTMPCDYSKYPKNWKTEIRPSVLERAKNCCENCNVPNYKWILRGYIDGIECYQDDDGTIFDANTSQRIGEGYVGDIDKPAKSLIKVVLTVAHLDHDTWNSDPLNLKALCQRCHNRYDVEFRKANRKKNKGILDLFE